MQWCGCRCSSDDGHAAQQALEAGGARRLRNESFFSAPQLKRDPLGRHTNMAGTWHSTRKGETSVRHTAGFVVAISLAGLGTLHAQSAACSPAAVTTDPSPVDTAYPPMMRAVLIPSAGVRL